MTMLSHIKSKRKSKSKRNVCPSLIGDVFCQNLGKNVVFEFLFKNIGGSTYKSITQTDLNKENKYEDIQRLCHRFSLSSGVPRK